MKQSNVRYWIALGASLLFCTGHGLAWAQTAADKAAADTLFKEGTKLISKGDYAAACEKFEASLMRVAQLGTQFSLASCYEKLGKTASAWGALRAAASAAKEAHDKRQRFFEESAAALEAKLSKMVIKIETTNRVDGLKIKCDGSEVTLAELDSPVPVDPGEHTVEASAPGRVSWSTKMSVPSTPGIVAVLVPGLEKVPAPRGPSRTRRILAYGLAGSGIALVLESLHLGSLASSRWTDAQSHCRDLICTPTGIAHADRAKTLGRESTVAFTVGVGVVAAAMIFFLTEPSMVTGAEHAPANPMALQFSPSVGLTHVGVTIEGGF